MANEYKLSYTAQEIDEKLGQISTPDWEQNDSQGEGYIKNRPFYSEGSAITFEPTTDMVIIESTFELTVGQSYKVSFTLNDGSITSQTLVAKTFNEMADANIPNGDKIICIASDGDDYDEYFTLINNFGPVDGEPAYVESSAVYVLRNCVSATLNVGKIKTIDPIYLPDYISKTETANEIQKATNEIQDEVANKIQNEVNKVKSEIPQSDYEENDSTSKAYIQNRPFYSIKDAKTVTETFYDSLNGDPTVDYVERETFDSIQAVLTPSTSVQQQFKEGAEITYTFEIYVDYSSYTGLQTVTRSGTVQKYSDELLYVGDAWLVDQTHPAQSEPWYCITYNINTNEITIYAYTLRFGAYSGANVTLSTSYLTDEIKQLDPKYIPDYISKTEAIELINTMVQQAIQEALYVNKEDTV